MKRQIVLPGAIALLLVTAAWFATTAAVRAPAARSQHSKPATFQPPTLVAVTPDGKLFHRPDCTYVHGPVRLESGQQAIADGYAPCTRCLKQ
jgi:hypothetical protein